MNSSLQILLFLALLILLAKGLGELSARFGLPAVLGELLAGVILGPTVLDIWHLPWVMSSPAVAGTDPVSLASVIKVLAQVGVVILMFLAGLETDTEMMKSVAGTAIWVAFGGVLLPLAGGVALARTVGFGWPEALFLGTVLTATSVSITAQTLMNLTQFRSRAGSTILGAAVIDDVMGLAVFSLVIAAATRTPLALGSGWVDAGLATARMLLFVLLAFWLGPRLVRFVFKSSRQFHGTQTASAVALVIAFVSAYLAECAGGMAGITGAYLAGLFSASTPARARVKEDIASMTNTFFGPLFFASVGLETNAKTLGGHLGFFLLILGVAVVGKVVGCGLGAWFTGLNGRECLAVGVGMIPRGEVGLITASIGLAAGLISSEAYSLVVVLVLSTTLITPVLLRFCFAPRAPENEKFEGDGAELSRTSLGVEGQARGSAATGLRTHLMARAAWVASLLVLVANTACGVKKIAVNKIGDALAKGGSTFASDDDPELVREAVPFSLKLMESLLAESPRHRGLLLAASRGFTQYAYGFVQEEADEMEDKDLAASNLMRGRARRLYLRARDYGLRGLEVRHRGFEKAFRENPTGAMRRATARDVPFLYWTAASWGAAISVSKDNPELIADQPIVEALIDRAFELTPDFDRGAIHAFLISYESARQGARGDPSARSRKHFDRALELSRGEFAGPYVALAETVSVQKQDRAEFRSLLERALAIDPDRKPESRLENLVMQRRARWLLARTDQLFAE